MSPEVALKLVSIFEGYFNHGEFRELVALFEVSLESLDNYEPKGLGVAFDCLPATNRIPSSSALIRRSRRSVPRDIILKSGVPNNFTIATSSSMVGVGSSADHLGMLVRNHSIASR